MASTTQRIDEAHSLIRDAGDASQVPYQW